MDASLKLKNGIEALDPVPGDARKRVNSLNDIANAANYYIGFTDIEVLDQLDSSGNPKKFTIIGGSVVDGWTFKETSKIQQAELEALLTSAAPQNLVKDTEFTTIDVYGNNPTPENGWIDGYYNEAHPNLLSIVDGEVEFVEKNTFDCRLVQEIGAAELDLSKTIQVEVEVFLPVENINWPYLDVIARYENGEVDYPLAVPIEPTTGDVGWIKLVSEELTVNPTYLGNDFAGLDIHLKLESVGIKVRNPKLTYFGEGAVSFEANIKNKYAEEKVAELKAAIETEGVDIKESIPVDKRKRVNSLADIANAANYYDGFKEIEDLETGNLYDIVGKLPNGNWSFVLSKDRLKNLAPNAHLQVHTVGNNGIGVYFDTSSTSWYSHVADSPDPLPVQNIDGFPRAQYLKVNVGDRLNYAFPCVKDDLENMGIVTFGAYMKWVSGESPITSIGDWCGANLPLGATAENKTLDVGNGWVLITHTVDLAQTEVDYLSGGTTPFIRAFVSIDRRSTVDAAELYFANHFVVKGDIAPPLHKQEKSDSIAVETDLYSKVSKAQGDVDGILVKNPLPDGGFFDGLNIGDVIPNSSSTPNAYGFKNSKGVQPYESIEVTADSISVSGKAIECLISNVDGTQTDKQFGIFLVGDFSNKILHLAASIRPSRADYSLGTTMLVWFYDSEGASRGVGYPNPNEFVSSKDLPTDKYTVVSSNPIQIPDDVGKMFVVFNRNGNSNLPIGQSGSIFIESLSYNLEGVVESAIKGQFVKELENADKSASSVIAKDGNSVQSHLDALEKNDRNNFPNYAFQDLPIGSSIVHGSATGQPEGIWRKTIGGGKASSLFEVISDSYSISGRAMKVSMVNGLNDGQLYQPVYASRFGLENFDGIVLKISVKIKFSHAVGMASGHMPIYCFDSEWSNSTVVYSNPDYPEDGSSATPNQYLTQQCTVTIPDGYSFLAVCISRSQGAYDGTEGYSFTVAGADFTIDGADLVDIRQNKEDVARFEIKGSENVEHEGVSLYSKLKVYDTLLGDNTGGSASIGFVNKIPQFVRKVYSKPDSATTAKTPLSGFERPAVIIHDGDSIVNQQWFRDYVLKGSSSGMFTFPGLQEKLKNTPFYLFPSGIGGASLYVYSINEWHSVLHTNPDLVVISTYTNDFNVEYDNPPERPDQIWDNGITPAYRNRLEEIIKMIKTYSTADILLESVSIGPLNTWDAIKASPGYKIAKALAIKHNIGFFDKAKYMYEKLTSIGWTDADFNSGWDSTTSENNAVLRWVTEGIYGTTDAVHPSVNGRLLMAMAFADQFPAINEWNGLDVNGMNAVTEKVNILSAHNAYRKHNYPWITSPDSIQGLINNDWSVVASSIYQEYYLIREREVGANKRLVFKVKGSNIDVLFRTTNTGNTPSQIQVLIDGATPSSLSRNATFRIDADQNNYATQNGYKERVNLIHRIDHNWTISEKITFEFVTDTDYTATGSVSGLLTNVHGFGDKDADNIWENIVGEQLIVLRDNFQISNGVRTGDKFYLMLANEIAIPQYNGDNWGARLFPVLQITTGSLRYNCMVALFWTSNTVFEIREVSEMKSDFNTWEEITIKTWDTIDISGGVEVVGNLVTIDDFEAAFMLTTGTKTNNYFYYDIRNQWADTLDGKRFEVSDTDCLMRLASQLENKEHTVEIRCIDPAGILNIYGVVGHSPEYDRK